MSKKKYKTGGNEAPENKNNEKIADETSANDSEILNKADTADVKSEDNTTSDSQSTAAKTKRQSGDAPGKSKGAGKGKRLKHGALAVTFTVIFVAAIVLINIIFNMVLARFDISADLSDNSMYTIDDTTAEYLSGVEDNISIIVASDEAAFENGILQGGQQYGKQVSQIIRSFAGANSRISAQYKDLDSNPAFYSKYGATLQAGSIIVESEKTGRNVIITSNDYLSPKYTYNGQEIDYQTFYTYYQMGAGSLLNIEYYAAAERSILSAIMNVTNENPVKVAVLSEDYGVTNPTALVSLLEANAYIVENFKLTTVEAIDSSYDYVIIYAPIYDFSNDDLNKIDMWLDNGGKYGKNLFYAAASVAEELPKLNAYLSEWGLSVGSGYVYQTNSKYGHAASPTYQVLYLNEGDYSEGVDSTTKHTTGDGLRPIKLLFEEESNYITSPIISSYDGAVIAPFDKLQNFDPSTAEESGEFVVAAESAKTRFEGVNPFSSRVFVTGGHYILDAAFMQSEQDNNSDIFLNIFNKTSGREKVEISITPKSYTVPTFEITAAQARGITVVFAVVVPLAVIAAGVVVIIRRKRR